MRSALAAAAVLTGVLVGIPLVVLGLGAAGLVGWIVAAIVLPLAVFVALHWLARRRG